MIEVASFGELDAIVLYQILRLRSEVFGVEQECIYNDLDGRDHEIGTHHVWMRAEGDVIAALRVIVEPDGSRVIGRVVTARQARGAGLASALVDRALALVPTGVAVHLHAQNRLERWYERWGFRRTGADVLIDGMAHVPMTRPPR